MRLDEDLESFSDQLTLRSESQLALQPLSPDRHRVRCWYAQIASGNSIMHHPGCISVHTARADLLSREIFRIYSIGSRRRPSQKLLMASSSLFAEMSISCKTDMFSFEQI